MSGVNNQLMRIAVAVEDQLSECSDVTLTIPSDQVQRYERLIRQFNVARQRRWFAAASRIRNRLRVALNELKCSLQTVNDAIVDHADGPAVCNLRHIYDDLLSLYDEFTDVRVDLKTRQISVTTEPLELEGVYLGRFEIQLTWNDLLNGHPRNYRVVALDPVPAPANDSVTHPHVQDESLCEGDGHLPILNALRQGRLYDFFVIVANLLRTYNSGSPYIALSDWHGVECTACGCTSSDDDIRSCEKCETSLCTDCCEFCEDCSGSFCSECTSCCECCSEYRCDRCLQPCSNCDAATCRGCLEDNERCSDCDKNEEKDAKANDGAANQFVSEVHSLSMGQAAVPA
jgi:hypothetical protein